MPDQTLDQLTEETVAQDADLLYIVRSGLDRRIKRSTLLQGTASASTSISSGPGLTGGGSLASSRTLQVDIAGLLEDTTPDPAVDYIMTHDNSANAVRKVLLSRITGAGSTNSFAAVSVSGQSSVIADSSADTLTLAGGSGISITTNAATDTVTIATTGLVPNTISVSAGEGLSGGGTLAANRSLAVNIAGQSEDTSPDGTVDYVMVHKGATGVLRKMRLGLLAGSAYTLPIASASVLGGIRLGSGLSADVNGVVSAVTTYTPPIATAGTLGVVRVGTGLAVTAQGVLSNSNPTPYVLPPATVNTIGGVKPGQNVSISADGTLDVAVGGSGVSDGAYRPESYGAIRGTGLTTTQRQGNTTAINACWQAAGAAGARVDMGGGTFEISGALTITTSGLTVLGDRCRIVQYLGSANIVAITSASLVTVKGLQLSYGTNQTSGDDPTTVETYVAALRLSIVTGSYFESITVSNAWVGIGAGGAGGCSDNTYVNCRVTMAAGNGYGIVHKAGSGNSFIGCAVSGAASPAKTVQGGVYLAGMGQSHFTEIRVDWLQCRRPIYATGCPALSFSGIVIQNITLVPTGAFGGIIGAADYTGIQVAGGSVSAITLNATTLGITDASVFCGQEGANFLATNVFIGGTLKTGTVRFAVLGHANSAAAKNVTGIFQQIRLDTFPDTPHRLDDLCYATVDPTSTSLDGPLLGYNNTFGAATGGFMTLGDVSLTAYASVHGRHLRFDAPLTTNRTVTLSQYIDTTYANGAINAPRMVRGAIVRVVRTTNATGSSSLIVANHNGSTLTTLAVNSAAEFVFDGTNWALQPGSASSGGGGSGGTFATQAEAEAGVSATTYMSPVRTKDAITSYASSNEVGGTEGQVVGFSAAGLATAVKNTRVIVITVLADDTAVTALAGARKMLMPIGLKVTSVTVYLPTTGTSSTVVDVNLGGGSILSSPLSVGSGLSSATTSTIATPTLSKNTVLSIDIDTAGSGAKGLQVSITGVEI